MSDLSIFLDDGGVMNDNRVRVPQWRQLVGEFLPPRLGGTPGAWSAANKIVADRVWSEYLHSLERDPAAEFAVLSREFSRSWLAGMCEIVGVDTPPDEQCVDLSRATAAYVTPRVRSAYPGAVDAIRELHERGYALGTASGEISPDVEGYLSGMEVRDLFKLPLFGPDLVNVHKHSLLYYRRIFERANVDPRSAVVVDDAPEVLDWPRSLGARTVLVTTGGPLDGDTHEQIACLADLPALLDGRLARA